MSAPHTDLETVRRLLQGDEQAFGELFESYFPKLYRFALVRLDGEHDEALEAVQQTFCNAFEHLDRYRGEASLYGWMCRILANVVTDRLRRRGRERRHVPLLEETTAVEGLLEALTAPSADRPDAQAARHELVRLIQATLDRLPEHYGDVLEWKYVDGISVNEIAARLALAPKAAESLLTRARAAFRQAIAAVSGSVELLGEGPSDRLATRRLPSR